ncbi:hypothetical protein FQN54_007669 [Arachnomyces sp. PD_36]|nr:hypothetical protein FQN54_007669 [Arachnomyces sp. PD_36]
MGMKDALKGLGEGVNSKTISKLTAEFPENVTTKNNVIKTKDLRIDLHKHISRPGWYTAKVQANTKAEDRGVQAFIRGGNKGSGAHAGTHKNIIEIPFERTKFDSAAFKTQIQQAYKSFRDDDDNGEESSKGKK